MSLVVISTLLYARARPMAVPTDKRRNTRLRNATARDHCSTRSRELLLFPNQQAPKEYNGM